MESGTNKPVHNKINRIIQPTKSVDSVIKQTTREPTNQTTNQPATHPANQRTIHAPTPHRNSISTCFACTTSAGISAFIYASRRAASPTLPANIPQRASRHGVRRSARSVGRTRSTSSSISGYASAPARSRTAGDPLSMKGASSSMTCRIYLRCLPDPTRTLRAR